MRPPERQAILSIKGIIGKKEKANQGNLYAIEVQGETGKHIYNYVDFPSDPNVIEQKTGKIHRFLLYQNNELYKQMDIEEKRSKENHKEPQEPERLSYSEMQARIKKDLNAAETELTKTLRQEIDDKKSELVREKRKREESEEKSIVEEISRKRAERENDSLLEEIRELKTEITEQKRQITEQKRQIAETQTELRSANQKLKNLQETEKNYHLVVAQLKISESQTETIKRQNDKLFKENLEYESKVNQGVNKIYRLENQINQLESNIIQLESERKNLKNLLESAEGKLLIAKKHKDYYKNQ